MVEKGRVARYRHHGSKVFSHGVSLRLPMSCERAWIASVHVSRASMDHKYLSIDRNHRSQACLALR